MISVCDHLFLNCVLLISAFVMQGVEVHEQFEIPSFALHEPTNKNLIRTFVSCVEIKQNFRIARLH
jgi:hypothetical protein